MARITPKATYEFKVSEVKYYLVKNKGDEAESFTTQDGAIYFFLNSNKYFKLKGHIVSTMKTYGDSEEIVTEKLSALIQGLTRRLK